MMMRLVFQDSASSDEGRDGEEVAQGRERERERERERDEETDFNASPNISLLGTVWLSDSASSGDAVLIHINTDLIQNNPLSFNRFYSGAATHFFIFNGEQKQMTQEKEREL